jgi:D-beta-D-heptose 7-phosphate kinase/D-beta-D-heptose 1-phosphate adenosyltransferase
LLKSREEKMLGGAGNVFANLQAMGCDTQFIAVIGHDGAGNQISDIIDEKGGYATQLIAENTRPTILKTRYVSQNQQLLRVDHEDPSVISNALQDKILEKAETLIEEVKVLVLSDYGKGMLTPPLIQKLIKLAKKRDVPVIVDPKGKDFSIYKGASIVTPNRKELSAAANDLPTKTNQDVEKAAKALIKQSGIDTVFATRSEDGMSVIDKKSKPIHLETKAQEVYDVSGAGDTVVAAIAASIASNGSHEDAAKIANLAGGLAVAKLGTAIIRQEELLKVAQEENIPMAKAHGISMIADTDSAQEKIKLWQAQGLKVGFTNGCFDIIHYGHVNYLNQAREKCDRLVVGLNHDKSVKILKGESRPINDEMARATVIAALGSVDMVVFFGAKKAGEDNTPSALVDILRPDILMKGGDYTVDQLPEGQVVLAYGGEVEIMPLYDGYSTTNIIKKSATS